MRAEDRETTTAGTAPDAHERPGLLVVHGNRAERLLELATRWTARWPLAPLEPETWLVPSQAVAQWVRQTLAAGPGGVAAGLDLLLPAQWLWQAYRALLGPAGVPDTAPLDEGPLTWRLWRLLPTLSGDTFAPLATYLNGDLDGRKRGQLARRLADLYDQYQVYRTDWLDDWAAGRDQIRDAHGQPHPLPQGERWQAALWRAIRTDLGGTDASAPTASRADIHAAFVAAVRSHAGPRPAGLPRRLTVFGLSGLPPATLEALALVARWTQVLVCVLNPCRVHWADVVPDAAWLARIDAHWRARAERRPGSPPLPDALGLTGQGHPLLAAWGRQGRDFIALLQAHEERPVRDRFDAALQALGSRVDLFEEPVPEGSAGTLLTQLQDDILHGRPLPETRDRWPAVDPASDHSLRFHVCHTALREVEVLHDQVLAALHGDPSLQPRDILVMVPDVAAYAPLFHAVFGRLPPGDPRHVPYTISDVADDAGTRLLEAVRGLIALPHSRIAASDVLEWLEVPAFARRFGVADADLDRLRRWVAEAGIRWGLDGHHRRALGLVAADDEDAMRLSWRDGLRRLWLGYALGPEDADWQGQVPARGVGPLEAALIERLQTLVDTLARQAECLATPATADTWVRRLQALLADCFDDGDPSTDPAEARALQGLRSALSDWGDEASAAGDEPLPLAVVADAWLARATPPAPGQRFLAGALTVATLLPMRAVPFRIIHLLGLQDGAYPRRQIPDDFDLMAGHPRPGDRLSRHEDHYLFLEALLSARERLAVSWVGRSPVDDGVRAPSALVGQLRDHVAAGWRLAGRSDADAGPALVEALTTRHRLHPFDAAYFPVVAAAADAPRAGDVWFSYAHEWIPARRRGPATSTLGPWAPDGPIDTGTLARFLRHPAQAFHQQRLQVSLPEHAAEDPDREPLVPDGLDRWRVDTDWVGAVVRSARAGQPRDQALATARAVWRRAVARGEWPQGPFGSALAADWLDAAPGVWRWADAFFKQYPETLPEPDILDERVNRDGLALRVVDVLGSLHRGADGTRARLAWQGSAVVSPGRGKAAGHYRLHALLPAWVRHLAHHRAGGPVQTWVISPRGEVVLSPLSAQQADAAWQALLGHWWAGMSAPCPFEPRSAAAWLRRLDRDGAASAWEAARAEYEGNEHQPGVRDRDPYWRRAFADFASLAGPPDAAADGPFARAAAALLRPLMQAIARPPVDETGDPP